MKAVVFHGVGDIRLDTVPEPKIKEKTDAIVRITASAICGTDLHMIRGTLPDMKPGTILGHEGVGIDQSVGSLAVGKDGDVALYDGDPFETTSHCVGVVIDGIVVASEPR